MRARSWRTEQNSNEISQSSAWILDRTESTAWAEFGLVETAVQIEVIGKCCSILTGEKLHTWEAGCQVVSGPPSDTFVGYPYFRLIDAPQLRS